MTQPRTINMQMGLPRRVTTTDPRELQRVLNQILAVLHTMNGEGDPDKRVVIASE